MYYTYVLYIEGSIREENIRDGERVLHERMYIRERILYLSDTPRTFLCAGRILCF